MIKKVWQISENIKPAAGQLVNELGISPLIARLLLNRGIVDPVKARQFLAPCLEQLHDPFLFRDMERAVARLRQAITARETVLIYGDYDVDGITSTALMIRILNKYFSGRLLYYIPKRLEEGYGLHLSSLEKAVAKGVKLIITVDCGISALKEAAFLKGQGVDLIITDHHEPPEILPEAYGIIDPKVKTERYPFPQLAGVGVAFKFLQGLCRQMPEIASELFANLDLVAFGTVADIVPLLEENRILVKYGLQQINQTQNIGLRSLIEVAGLKGRELNSGHIGYVLAPRINAAGRMGNSSIGVKLFLTKDPAQGWQYAKGLEQENQTRQVIETAVLEEAQAQIGSEPGWAAERALVLAGEDWHLGVIGIVASKLVDIYHKPVILIGMDGEEGRGSGRSIAGFNLFGAIEHCGEHLMRFGGHEFAAGLSLRRDQFFAFKSRFLQMARERLTDDDLLPVLQIEGLIDLRHATLDLVQELTQLAPCGACNPTPVLACEALNLVDFRYVGENGRHLKVRVKDNDVIREGIGFNLGGVYQELGAATEVDLAFSLEENIWNGSASVQLNLKDLRTSGETIKRVS